MTQFTYVEDVQDISPQGAGFSYKDGRATSRYKVYYTPNNAPNTLEGDLNPVQLAAAVKEILGDVQPQLNSPGLKRKLPLAHPVFPWLYASEVNEIKGIGPISWENVNNAAFLSAPAISTKWGTYAPFEFTITFTPRPYAVLPDNAMRLQEGQRWYPYTNFNPTIGPPDNDPGIQYNYINEYERFVDWEPHPQPDSVTANQGQMYFANVPAIGGQAPVFAAMPRLFLNNQQISLMWYQVPLTYITSPNSYIKMYRGRINQNRWMNWQPGELLFLNYSLERFTPPVQKTIIVGGGANEHIQFQFDQSKYCNIRFDFLETVRAVSSTDAGFTPAAKNWVVGGHNLVPYALDRGFHYATIRNLNDGAMPNGSNQNYWMPSWLSFDFPLLFTNPDYQQPQVQIL